MFIEQGIDRLRFFEDLYRKTKDRLGETMSNLTQHMEQYKGSDKIDGSTERAGAVRNITYELIESQVHSDIPAPKVSAKRYSERHEKNAISIERLLAKLRDELPFEEFNDMDERYTYIYGGSIWLVEWDSEKRDVGERGGVKVTCINPRDFFPQPNIYRVEDMEYCFLRFVTTREELVRRWGISHEDAMGADTEWESESLKDEDSVTVLLCFYRDEAGDVSQFAWSGETILSDLPRYYARKTCRCKKCGQDISHCHCETPKREWQDTEGEILTHGVAMGDGRILSCLDERGERRALPYYLPKSFPIVVRKNTSCDKQLLGQSDCEFLRPEQQAINKVESRIMQKLMRSGVTPLVPEDATITVNNAVFGQVIRLRPGENASHYGIVDTTPDIAQDIAQAERLYQNAKRIIGISDAYQGIEKVAESGYARQIRVQQAAGRLESKRRMKYTAYATMDRLIFELYLAFADEPRLVTYMDSYGNKHSATFNRYDFLEEDLVEGAWRYDDGYLFSVDLSGGPEAQREEMWEKNLANLQAGTLGDPALPSTLLRYWQLQERSHYPYAGENVTYFSERIREGGGTDETTEEKTALASLADIPGWGGEHTRPTL